jgi:hypothetical protein
MTNELKYIIVDRNGLEAPIIFSELFKHNEVLNLNEHKIVSAGTCTIFNDGQFTSRMGSVSLGIEWNKERDIKDWELLKSRLFSSMY